MIPPLNERLDEINSFDGNLIFGSKKFHAATNRTGAGRPSEGGLVAEHAKIVVDTGKERYLPAGDWWESVSVCPVCENAQHEAVLSRLGLTIRRCVDCTHWFQSPRINLNKAIELYSDDATAAAIYTQPMQLEIDAKKYRYGLKLLEQAGVPSLNGLLDFGCGVGLFLREADAMGWQRCVGIDANQNYQASYQGSDEIQFINTNFESLAIDNLGQNYSAITMWNVLEHLYNPLSVLTQLRDLLASGGLLLVMIPNVESLATRVIREKSATFNWKHVSHFSARSLRVLMARAGFREQHLETVISEIDNVKSYLLGAHPYHGHGDPQGIFDFITPEFIHKNLLGSRILAVFSRD